MTATKKVLLALVVAAMTADLLTFLLFTNDAGGVSNELNPVMQAVFHWQGLWALALFKVGLTAVLVFLVSRVSRPRMLAFAAAVPIFAGLLGVYSNTAAYLLALGVNGPK